MSTATIAARAKGIGPARRLAPPIALAISGQIVPWLVPIALLAVWEAAARMGWLPSRILPAPSHVFTVGWSLTVSGELPMHLWVSLKRAGASMLIGAVLGIGLGVLNGLFRIADATLDSSVQMLRTIPSLALIPLAILWFGIGEECKLFLMVTGAFFPMYITTYNGIRGIDPKLVEVARIYGLNRAQLVRHALLPSALPAVLVGVRMALGLMWINLIVVETIATDRGIGYLVNNAREFMQTDIIVLGIILYALLGKAADAGVRAVERHVVTWNTQFKGL